MRRYATLDADRGTIRLGNTGATARGPRRPVENAMIGVNLENNGGTLRRLTVEHNGMLGIGANASYDMCCPIRWSARTTGSDSRRMPVSGGVKITRSRGVTVSNNDVSRNYSSGLWLDESVYDSKVVGNTVVDNEWTGIQLELSSKAVVAGNTVTGGKTGIQIIGTDDVRVYNNSVGGFSQFGIKVAAGRASSGHGGHRPGPSPADPRPDDDAGSRARSPSRTTPSAAAGTYQVYVLDAKTNRRPIRWASR